MEMKETIVNIPVTDYLEQYKNSDKKISPELLSLKDNAIGNFESLGFPTTKNEEWKYTSLSNLLKNKFSVAAKEQNLSKDEINQFVPAEEKRILLVFENGRFNKKLSEVSALPKGMIVGDISENSDHPELKKHLGKIASHQNESLVALNTSLFQQGAFIFAGKGVICDIPIHLLFVNDARHAATVSYPRNLIVAAPGSQINISESYYSITATNPSFCNSVTEIFVDDNASVEFCKNESENNNDFHIDYTSAILRRDSKLNIHTITTGGRMVRNNLRIELQERNGSAILNGLYITAGENHVDNHSFVDHASPDCYSNELYKGVLNGSSKGVFNGKIFVRKDAQKTNAYQSNKNVLLSDDASMNAKPQLEIYADDVKCSHGATTGQIDKEAMFYLRSRGIGENASRALLTTAFADEIVDRISFVPLKEKLKDLIHSKLMRGND